MTEPKPPRRARVRCSGCGHEYGTWWTPIEFLYTDEVAREDLAAARVVVCPECGRRDEIGRNLALYDGVFRETTPEDPWGPAASPVELQAYVTELERQLRGLSEYEIKSFRLRGRGEAPLVEVVFEDQRVPGVAFGYRSHIWDSDPVVWWANFMEDTEACPAWAREHDERPTDIVWICR